MEIELTTVLAFMVLVLVLGLSWGILWVIDLMHGGRKK